MNSGGYKLISILALEQYNANRCPESTCGGNGNDFYQPANIGSRAGGGSNLVQGREIQIEGFCFLLRVLDLEQCAGNEVQADRQSNGNEVKLEV